MALNAERAAEEARGLVRWLRPEFQCLPGSGVFGGSESSTGRKTLSAKDSRPPAGGAANADDAAVDSAAERIASGRRTRGATRKGSGVFGGLKALGKAASTTAKDSRPRKLPWPKERAGRTKAVQEALAGLTEPATAAELARRFVRAQKVQVEEILEALVSLGLAHRRRGGKYSRE